MRSGVPTKETKDVRPSHLPMRRECTGRASQEQSMRVANILSVARERLVTIQADALLTEAAKLLGGTHRALLVVCDSKEAMAGVLTKTDIVRQVALCHGDLSD